MILALYLTLALVVVLSLLWLLQEYILLTHEPDTPYRAVRCDGGQPGA